MPVAQPRLSPRASVADVEAEDPRASGESVPFGVARGEVCEIGVDFDQVRAEARAAAEDGEGDRADAGADVGEPAVGKIRRRGEQGGVGASPVAPLRLDKGQTSAEPGVAGQPVFW